MRRTSSASAWSATVVSWEWSCCTKFQDEASARSHPAPLRRRTPPGSISEAAGEDPNASTRQQLLDARLHHLERHPVLAPLGHDDVGPALRRLDELEVHRPHRVEGLAQHVLPPGPALRDMAAEAAHEPHVG